MTNVLQAPYNHFYEFDLKIDGMANRLHIYSNCTNKLNKKRGKNAQWQQIQKSLCMPYAIVRYDDEERNVDWIRNQFGLSIDCSQLTSITSFHALLLNVAPVNHDCKMRRFFYQVFQYLLHQLTHSVNFKYVWDWTSDIRSFDRSFSLPTHSHLRTTRWSIAICFSRDLGAGSTTLWITLGAQAPFGMCNNILVYSICIFTASNQLKHDLLILLQRFNIFLSLSSRSVFFLHSTLDSLNRNSFFVTFLIINSHS